MKQYIWYIRGALLVLLACWVGMLHFFSAQPAAESGSLSEGICYRIAQLTVANFEECSPEEQAEIIGRFQKPVRKTAHFCEYALGGIPAMALLGTFSLTPLVTWLVGGGFGVVNAVLDEWHQGFVAGRSPEAGDAVLDSIGFVCGMAAMLLFLWVRKKRALR